MNAAKMMAIGCLALPGLTIGTSTAQAGDYTLEQLYDLQFQAQVAYGEILEDLILLGHDIQAAQELIAELEDTRPTSRAELHELQEQIRDAYNDLSALLARREALVDQMIAVLEWQAFVEAEIDRLKN